MSGRADAIASACMVLAGLALLCFLPQIVDTFRILQLTLYVVLAIFTLSLAFVWGYGGIFCFGQAAFFGLGGYCFAIAAINLGDTTVPFLLAIACPAAAAAALGYFLFYSRLSDVYLGVVTMVFALILWKLLNSTSAPEYAIGAAPLGGFNGIPAVPPLNVPGQPSRPLDPTEIFQVALGLLIAVYVMLKLVLRTRFGRVAVAIRENETRASLLGYDVRLRKLLIFTIGGAIAGMAGALYATYQTFIDPNALSLEMSAKAIIWVMAGGAGTLLGPVAGCIVLQFVSFCLADVQWVNNLILFGAILCVMVVLLPRGIVPSLGDAALWLYRRRQPVRPAVEVAAQEFKS